MNDTCFVIGYDEYKNVTLSCQRKVFETNPVLKTV